MWHSRALIIFHGFIMWICEWNTYILLKHCLLKNNNKTKRKIKPDGWMDGCKFFAQNLPVLLMSNYKLKDELVINFFSMFNTMLTAAQSWNIMNDWIDMQSWQTLEDHLFTPQTLPNQRLLMTSNSDYKHQNL